MQFIDRVKDQRTRYSNKTEILCAVLVLLKKILAYQQYYYYVTCMACNVITILGKSGNAIISSWSRLTIGMEDRVWIIWMATGHRLAFLYSLKHCLRNPSVSE